MNFNYIENRDKISSVISELISCQEIGLDIETTSLDNFSLKILLLQLEINNKIFILDVQKLGGNIIKYILSVIKDSNKLVIGHQIKFDVESLFVFTEELLTNLFDTMIAETLIYQGVGKQYYSLKELVYKYCGRELDKSERDSFSNFSGDFTNEQLIYSALDVAFLNIIRKEQEKILFNQGQYDVLELEKRLIAPVSSMELNGVSIDVDYWNSLKIIATSKKEKLLNEIKNNIVSRINLNSPEYASAYDIAIDLKIPVQTKREQNELMNLRDSSILSGFIYNNININSYTQILRVLNKFGLDIPNTNEKTLKDYKDKDSLIPLLLDYREQEKKITTYGDSFLSDINPVTNRFHVDYNQVGTVTGRFSASRMHQIPKEAEYRKAFIPRPGYKILAADYSQQEYRLAGAISGEPRIIDAYLSGKDMHTATAGIIFNKNLEDITKDERYLGKTLNFAVLYGSSSWGLSKNLGIKIEEGEKLLDKFWKGYPTLYQFKLNVENIILKHKYSVTPLGRKRYFEDRKFFDDDKDHYKYLGKIRREGFNHIIQGCGADIIKIAMCRIFYDNPFGDKLKLYHQVHDEIGLEISEGIIEEAREFVLYCMLEAEQPFLGNIPAKVDILINNYWEKG